MPACLHVCVNCVGGVLVKAMCARSTYCRPEEPLEVCGLDPRRRSEGKDGIRPPILKYSHVFGQKSMAFVHLMDKCHFLLQ